MRRNRHRIAVAGFALALFGAASPGLARDGWNSPEGWRGPGPGMGDAPQMDPAFGVTIPFGKAPESPEADPAQPLAPVGCGETVTTHYDASGNLVTTTTQTPC